MNKIINTGTLNVRIVKIHFHNIFMTRRITPKIFISLCIEVTIEIIAVAIIEHKMLTTHVFDNIFL